MSVCNNNMSDYDFIKPKKGIFIMFDHIPPILRDMAKTSYDMWTKGWAEANGGNLSLRLDPEKVKAAAGLAPKAEWQPLGAAQPELGGDCFLVSGTGRFLRNISLYPEKNIGIIEMDAAGAKWRPLWGFEPAGRPTSELEAHLRTHAVIKAASGGVDHAVIHTHTPHLIALTYALADLDTAGLTRLLWQMHAECIVGFPQGVEFLPWMMAGTDTIAQATAAAMRRRKLAVWQFHGVVGVGRNLDAAFGLIDMAEKAAQLWFLAMSAGGVKARLTDDQLRAIAKNFKVTPASDILPPHP